MNDDSQIHIPESFVWLFVPRGRPVPRQRGPEIARRFEVCEDMAGTLVPHAQALQFKHGLNEADVIAQLLQSLLPLTEAEGNREAVLSLGEAQWVVCKLAEQLDWTAHLGPELRALAGPA